jgi:hypothetical protein
MYYANLQVLVSQGPRGPVTMPVGPCRVWYQNKGDTLGNDHMIISIKSVCS